MAVVDQGTYDLELLAVFDPHASKWPGLEWQRADLRWAVLSVELDMCYSFCAAFALPLCRLAVLRVLCDVSQGRGLLGGLRGTLEDLLSALQVLRDWQKHQDPYISHQKLTGKCSPRHRGAVPQRGPPVQYA